MSAVIVVTEYAGPSSRLLAGYAAVYRHTTTRGRVPGLVDHVVGTNRDGITIIEQWESTAVYRSYAESPAVRAAAADSGLPLPTVQVLDVFGPSRQLVRLAS